MGNKLARQRLENALFTYITNDYTIKEVAAAYGISTEGFRLFLKRQNALKYEHTKGKTRAKFLYNEIQKLERQRNFTLPPELAKYKADYEREGLNFLLTISKFALFVMDYLHTALDKSFTYCDIAAQCKLLNLTTKTMGDLNKAFGIFKQPILARTDHFTPPPKTPKPQPLKVKCKFFEPNERGELVDITDAIFCKKSVI